MISDFEKTFREKQKEVHKVAKDKGWYEQPQRTALESLMLIVTELAEAAEELRKPDAKAIYRAPGGKYEGIAIELADAVIRIMDLCEAEGLPLAQAIEIKNEYNKTRPHRHGGKRY